MADLRDTYGTKVLILIVLTLICISYLSASSTYNSIKQKGIVPVEVYLSNPQTVEQYAHTQAITAGVQMFVSSGVFTLGFLFGLEGYLERKRAKEESATAGINKK